MEEIPALVDIFHLSSTKVTRKTVETKVLQLGDTFSEDPMSTPKNSMKVPISYSDL